MFKNYFIFARLADELNRAVKGAVLVECWSQSKSILTLGFGHPDGRDIWAELCVNPSMPFIFYRDSASRASKNVADLFPEALNSAVTGIDIASDDRIIRISLEKGFFYYFVRGPHSNIIFETINGQQSSFKKIKSAEKEKAIAENIKLTEFTSEPFSRQFNIPPADADDPLLHYKSAYPFLGREIINEIGRRSGINSAEEIIDELKHTPFSVSVGKDHEVTLLPARFYRAYSTEEKIFPSANGALREFVLSTLYHKKYHNLYERIENYLLAETETASKRIRISEARISAGDRSEEYNITGHLIMANLHNLKKGMKSAEVEDLYGGGGTVKLKLKEDLSPYENAEYYYKKARGNRHELELAAAQISRYGRKLLSLNSAFEKLKSGLNYKDLEKLASALKLTRNEKRTDKKLEIKFRHYIIDEKYDVYVGKDSKNNDLLTFRFGKPNDYWFHARGVPGSHVILKNPGKDGVPKEIIKKTASVAAFYSKAKNGSFVPVAYTFRKFVLKKKGLEQGQVILQRESVVMAEPGIPAGCINPDADEE